MWWLILLGLAALTVGGIYIERKTSSFDCWNAMGAIMTILGAIALVIALAVWSCNYCDTKARIAAYEAVQTRINVVNMDKLDSFERSVFQKEVLTQNKWLASTRTYNKIFDPIYPDKIDALQPLSMGE